MEKISAIAPRFYIHGYYGNQNLGDEAILIVLVEGLRKLWPDCEISIVSADTGSPKRVGVNKVGDWQEAICQSDVVIIGGGGMFDDAGPHGWRDQIPMFREIRFAKANQKKIIFLAVGAGPFKTLLGKLIFFLDGLRADLITVRDLESLRGARRCMIAKRKLKVTADLAWMLSKKDMRSLEGINAMQKIHDLRRPIIGVNVFSYSALLFNSPQVDRERRQALGIVLNEIMEDTGGSAVFISAQGNRDGDDYHEAMRLISEIRHQDRCMNIEYLPEPGETKTLLASIDCLIAMKLHASLLAYSEGVPVIGLSYHTKIDGFYEYIGESDMCFNVNNLSPMVLKNAITKTLEKEEDEKAKRLVKTKELIIKAQDNLDYLRRIIEETKINE